ncbi:WGxxGxxG family protein [Paenibacillus rhizophilus]|uniref:WGxxGxxG-CTERM domain-containing protein n=1 Tax=Paenibacillus rhizophilus TaxID=1850366 RepID=A0A3N9P708_9BACL|nr:WGxxGxxG family protein [Paenibacillus rhizophilus]RQW11589.1 hypothetical protein EH198_11250 [Paenibacillus rhizophilus]
MKKLMASLACSAVLSMSLMGVGYASNATETVGMEGTAFHGTGTNDGMTGNMYRGDGVTNPTGIGNMRTNDNTITGAGRTDTTVTPLANTTRTGNYRATAANNNRNNNVDWGWLGLIGLLGLAGMRNKSREHR